MRKALLGVLAIAFVLEAVFTAGGFFAPDALLAGFKLAVSPDTAFLGFVTAWFLLFVTAVCGIAWRWVKAGDAHGWMLSYFLGAWWIGIGIGIYLKFGRPDNLFLDTLKGMLIVGFAAKSDPRRVRTGG